MSTPIGDKLETLFNDVRENAYKRGHLKARLDLIKTIETINLEQRTAAWLVGELMAYLTNTETPKPPVKRTRKPKTKPEVN